MKLNPVFDDLSNHETILTHVQELKKNSENSTFNKRPDYEARYNFFISNYVQYDIEIPKDLKSEFEFLKLFQPKDDRFISIREKHKIDVREIIPPPQIAWSLLNTKKEGEAILGTLGDFGLIIGKAKSRKSFFISIAISTALGNSLILNRFKSYLPTDRNEVAYFDTEQSKYYVQKAVKRICEQSKQPEPTNLNAFHLRSLNPLERLNFIENEIYTNDKISFVVIDGIKDLINSINDENEATMIASKLLKWSEERNIYILTVLHQNKSDNNARGHIGTELINKAQTVLSVTKSENDENISIVEPQQCRDIEPEVFAFEINDSGIPIIAEDFEVRTETKKNKFDITDLEDTKKYQLLTEVFSKGKYFSYGKLVEQIQIAYKNQFQKQLGTNRAKYLITDCSNNGWLIQEKPKSPYSLGTFENDHVPSPFILNNKGGVEDFA